MGGEGRREVWLAKKGGLGMTALDKAFHVSDSGQKRGAGHQS